MNAVIGFLVGLAITIGVVFASLLYLRSPLQLILTDLCGTAGRARFWTAFSNVTLFLIPLVFALSHQPDADVRQALVFVICGQIEWAIIGFVVSVVVLGFILSRYIPRINHVRAEGRDAAR
jgi:membrane protease YdiL (CAAX protease family)